MLGEFERFANISVSASVSECLMDSPPTNTLSVFYTNKMWSESVRMSNMTVMTELFELFFNPLTFVIYHNDHICLSVVLGIFL